MRYITLHQRLDLGEAGTASDWPVEASMDDPTDQLRLCPRGEAPLGDSRAFDVEITEMT